MPACQKQLNTNWESEYRLCYTESFKRSPWQCSWIYTIALVRKIRSSYIIRFVCITVLYRQLTNFLHATDWNWKTFSSLYKIYNLLCVWASRSRTSFQIVLGVCASSVNTRYACVGELNIFFVILDSFFSSNLFFSIFISNQLKIEILDFSA